MERDHGVCPGCGRRLEVYEGEDYCPACTRWASTGKRVCGLLTVLAVLLALLVLALPGRAADLAITVANVAKGSSATTVVGTASQTITAGQALYVAADGTLKPAISSGTALQATFAGVALHGSLSGQPIAYQTGGSVTIGATVTVGTIYVVSATTGNIAPWADLVTGNFVTVVGYGLSSTQIQLLPTVTGLTHP